MNDNKEYMTSHELLEYLPEYAKLSYSNLRTLVFKRAIPHYKNGKILMFKKVEIDLWVKKRVSKLS